MKGLLNVSLTHDCAVCNLEYYEYGALNIIMAQEFSARFQTA